MGRPRPVTTGNSRPAAFFQCTKADVGFIAVDVGDSNALYSRSRPHYGHPVASRRPSPMPTFRYYQPSRRAYAPVAYRPSSLSFNTTSRARQALRRCTAQSSPSRPCQSTRSTCQKALMFKRYLARPTRWSIAHYRAKSGPGLSD